MLLNFDECAFKQDISQLRLICTKFYAIDYYSVVYGGSDNVIGVLVFDQALYVEEFE